MSRESMEWNFEMKDAPRDGTELLGLFFDWHEGLTREIPRYEVMAWDQLENEGWLSANNFEEIEGHPHAWVIIPVPDPYKFRP